MGRTGVFIALDIALNQAREEGKVDIIGIINNMRTQRMKAVQTLVSTRLRNRSSRVIFKPLYLDSGNLCIKDTISGILHNIAV